ncbi:acyl-CoA carboxylase epsilon subunit [Streptomyces sp. GESEQ-35]|uniref:acyl-CoA carboxylase epsilon subunit n=1 Tax=Streptomyces sp. GESEQ-35 TaxID=2812657 RepID=UPI001B32949A|nr:acyl-CoA carboxylase epsilon subunit [Streptomyces sp. GESEQ-35]
MKRVETVLRVERGLACEDELAALTAALLMMRGRAQEEAERLPAVAPCWEARPTVYRAPGSWR